MLWSLAALRRLAQKASSPEPSVLRQGQIHIRTWYCTIAVLRDASKSLSRIVAVPACTAASILLRRWPVEKASNTYFIAASNKEPELAVCEVCAGVAYRE